MAVLHPNAKNLVGQTFGRLTVIEYLGKESYAIFCRCRCDCGEERKVRSSDLLRGSTRSCGCLRVKHGHTIASKASRVYQNWSNMMQRCHNPKAPGYQFYGGRGISVCVQWHDFSNYLADITAELGEQPEGTTIDRIDNALGYQPGNVRYATDIEQANNTRWNVKITYKGEIHTIAELARLYGVKKGLLAYRIRHGWSVERALHTPVASTRITYNGETHTIPQWAKIVGLSKETLTARIKRQGWPIERALNEPLNTAKNQGKRNE